MVLFVIVSVMQLVMLPIHVRRQIVVGWEVVVDTRNVPQVIPERCVIVQMERKDNFIETKTVTWSVRTVCMMEEAVPPVISRRLVDAQAVTMAPFIPAKIVPQSVYVTRPILKTGRRGM